MYTSPRVSRLQQQQQLTFAALNLLVCLWPLAKKEVFSSGSFFMAEFKKISGSKNICKGTHGHKVFTLLIALLCGTTALTKIGKGNFNDSKPKELNLYKRIST